MYKFGFLGLGKMGSSILNGIISKNIYKKEELIFYAPSEETKKTYTEFGLKLANDEKELFELSNIILLAIKPQKYDEVLSKISCLELKDKTIISLAPGKSISYLSSFFKNCCIVRAMPNTPALIGEAVSTICYNGEPIDEINNIFSSIGVYSIVKEKQIDEAIPLNGSMPAYIFEFVKVFVECAKSYGINQEDAYKLALYSIIGSCNLALSSQNDLDTLISNVCSKGGSTIAGLNELKNNGFEESIKKCYDACVKRSIELGNS